jgi:hypothetical protein
MGFRAVAADELHGGSGRLLGGGRGGTAIVFPPFGTVLLHHGWGRVPVLGCRCGLFLLLLLLPGHLCAGRAHLRIVAVRNRTKDGALLMYLQTTSALARLGAGCRLILALPVVGVTCTDRATRLHWCCDFLLATTAFSTGLTTTAFSIGRRSLASHGRSSRATSPRRRGPVFGLRGCTGGSRPLVCGAGFACSTSPRRLHRCFLHFRWHNEVLCESESGV